ncbi:MAG: hypothetical protein JO317_09460 [Verrucomicrobiae bacterium]|nr:hypothetical protein [Verrucomicrobiae bacterium]
MRALLLLFISIVLSVRASGAPAVTSVSPTSVSPIWEITGAGFGVKSPAAPLVWADFENGLEPSALGLKRKWDTVQSLTTAAEGPDGSRCAKASDGSGKWTLMVSYDSWTREGQAFYVYKKLRLNFKITDPSQNWKIWRMWPAHFGYPNIYAAENNGRVYVEGVDGESGFWGRMGEPTTDWRTEEIIGRASSRIGAKDGPLEFRRDGKKLCAGTILTRTKQSQQLMTQNFVVHGVLANASQWHPEWSDNNRLWADDVYVDTTWARVIVGDAPKIEACRRFAIQIPTAWSDTRAQFHSRFNGFDAGEQVYLYLYNAAGECNADGFPVRR